MVSGIIVSSDRCPWCKKLKERLQDDGIVFEVVSVEEAKERGIFDEEWRTIPQLSLNGVFIGGYEAYLESFANKHMKRRVVFNPNTGFCRFK
jgi:glutaredoxin